MGTVPERLRRRLPSEVVGTLGVDATQAQIFESSGRAIAGIATSLEKRDAQRARASSARDTFVNRTEANKQMVQFNRGLNRIGADAKNQDEYNSQTSELLEDFSTGFESEEARHAHLR